MVVDPHYQHCHLLSFGKDVENDYALHRISYHRNKQCRFLFLRPSLSEKSFPVRRVTAKRSVSGGWELFFSVFNFSLTRMS